MREISVGVLAIQGSFIEHQSVLYKCSMLDILQDIKLKVIKVSEAKQVTLLDGLIIPGGESTVIRRLLKDDILYEFQNWARNTQHVVFGTCAGLILLSKNIENETAVDRANNIGIMDVTVNRNYFGRQLNSFEGCVFLKDETMIRENEQCNGTANTCSGIFIRAPAVTSVNSNNVKTLATITMPGVTEKEVIVGVQDKNCIALAFHPELTEDLQWHVYFLKEVIKRKYNK